MATSLSVLVAADRLREPRGDSPTSAAAAAADSQAANTAGFGGVAIAKFKACGVQVSIHCFSNYGLAPVWAHDP